MNLAVLGPNQTFDLGFYNCDAIARESSDVSPNFLENSSDLSLRLFGSGFEDCLTQFGDCLVGLPSCSLQIKLRNWNGLDL